MAQFGGGVIRLVGNYLVVPSKHLETRHSVRPPFPIDGVLGGGCSVLTSAICPHQASEGSKRQFLFVGRFRLPIDQSAHFILIYTYYCLQ